MHKSNHGNAGFGLVELAFLVALGALIVLGALFLYSGMKNSQVAENFSEDIQKMRLGINKLYQGRGHYAGLGNASIKTNNDIVSSSLTSGTIGANIKHPWSLTMDGVNVSPFGGNSQFRITISDLKIEECAKLSAYLLPHNYQSFLINGQQTSVPEGIASHCLLASPATLVLISF